MTHTGSDDSRPDTVWDGHHHSASDAAAASGQDAGPLLAPGATASRLPGSTLVWDPPTRSWQRVGLPEEQPEAPAVAPSRHERPSVLRAGLIGGLVGALLASLLTVGALRLFPERTREGLPVERVLAPVDAASRGDGGTIVQIAQSARPSVVNIDVTGQRGGVLGGQFQGNGSGVILRRDGLIITNAHVVAGSAQVAVTLSTGDRLPARVVASDPDTDIAVVRVDRDDLPPAVIGSAKDLRVGELAVAIGSPLGLEQSVTAGIVSALGRTVPRPGRRPLVDMIQSDAAVTQGNSGGGLFNGQGALIGINTAIAASPQVGAEGIAFAIPIDIAKAIFDELVDTGSATHPWIGIEGATLDPTNAQRFGVDRGALVVQVVPGAPAERAGLQAQDVIVAVEGTQIDGMDDVVIAIRERKVGDTISIEYVRDGERRTASVTLADRPAGP